MLGDLLAAAKKTARTRRNHSQQRCYRPLLETLEGRCVLSTAYLATDLVSDQPGVAPIQDQNLVNGWGIAVNPSAGGCWVSSNG